MTYLKKFPMMLKTTKVSGDCDNIFEKVLNDAKDILEKVSDDGDDIFETTKLIIA